MDGSDQWNSILRSAVLVAIIATAGLTAQTANGQTNGNAAIDESMASGPSTNSAVVIRHRSSESSQPINSADDMSGPADTGIEQGVDDTGDSASLQFTAHDNNAPVVDASGSRAVIDTAAIEALPLGTDSGILDLGEQNDARSRERAGLVEGLVEFSQVGGALAVVVGLLVLAAFIMKRMSGGFAGGAGRPSGILQILARYPVGRGQSLVLLKIDRHILLVHQSGSSMSTLTELTDPNDVASVLAKVEASERDSVGGSFHRMLNKAGESYRSSRTKIETIDLTRPNQARRLKTSAQGSHITA